MLEITRGISFRAVDAGRAADRNRSRPFGAVNMGVSVSAAKARAFQGKSALRKVLTLRMAYRGGDRNLPHNMPRL